MSAPGSRTGGLARSAVTGSHMRPSLATPASAAVTFVPGPYSGPPPGFPPPGRPPSAAGEGDDRVPLLAPAMPTPYSAAPPEMGAMAPAPLLAPPKGVDGPFHSFAVAGDVSALRSLLDRGQRVDVPDSKGRTALWLAARHGRDAACRLLLEHGASPTAAGDDDGTVGADKGLQPIHAACLGGHEDVVRLLLESGVPADAPREDGSTPLRSAAFKGAEGICRLLLDRGARIDAEVKGSTALHLAAFRGSAPVVRLLLERGAPVAAQDSPLGRTPLHVCKNGDAARLLIEYGAPVNVAAKATREKQPVEGWTPLHNAANMGIVDVARELVAAGAAIEALDSLRRTPLIVSCEVGEPGVARVLLDAGASWDCEDASGASALEHALRWRQASLVDPFLDCERVRLAPGRVAAVCRPLVDAVGPECRVADVVLKFPAAKLNAALFLAKLLQAASRTNPDQSSLLLERRDEAVAVSLQLLDAMGQTFVERMQRRARLKKARVPWIACMDRLRLEKDGWELENRLAKCVELTPNDALDTWLAQQLYERKRRGDKKAADEFFTAAVDKHVPIADSVDALERRLPEAGSALDLAIQLDLYDFMGHPVVQRYVHRLSQNAPPLEARSLLPPLLAGCSEAEVKQPPPEAEGQEGPGEKEAKKAPPAVGPQDGGLLWWETPGHLLNSWKGKFAADFGAFVVLLVLMALVVSCWVGEHSRAHLPLLTLLAVHSFGMLLFEHSECRERGAADYFGDFFNIVDIAVLAAVFGLSSVALFGEAVPGYSHLGGYTVPVLALVFIPASFRLLEFGYIGPILGPMLVVFARMARDVFSVAIVISIVFISFSFALWGWAASFRAAEGALSYADTASSLYLAILGESNYDAVRSGVPVVGSALYSIYQIITVILLLNVLIGLFSFSFTAIFENSRHVYAFGRAKIILRYNRMGRRLVPPLNLVWLLLFPFPRAAALFVNLVSAVLLLPPLLLVLALASLWRLVRGGPAEEDEARREARQAWLESIEAHRLAQLAGLADCDADATLLKGRLAWDGASERPDAVPPGPLAVAHTEGNLHRNVELLSGEVSARLRAMEMRLEEVCRALAAPPRGEPLPGPIISQRGL